MCEDYYPLIALFVCITMCILGGVAIGTYRGGAINDCARGCHGGGMSKVSYTLLANGNAMPVCECR